MTVVSFIDSAEEEYLAEVGRYAEISAVLSRDLVDEVASALHRIAAFPEHGSPYFAGTRRIILRGFPFQLVYLYRADAAVVVAFAHQRRRPGYWRNRVDRAI